MIRYSFEDLVWMLLQATIIFLIVGISAMMLRGRSPAFASLLLAGGLVASACLAIPLLIQPMRWSWHELTTQPSFTNESATTELESGRKQPQPDAKSSAGLQEVEHQVTRESDSPLVAVLPSAIDALAASFVHPSRMMSERNGISKVHLVVIWSVSSGVALLFLAAGLGLLSRYRRVGHAVNEPEVNDRLRRWCERLSISRIPEIREGIGISQAATWGIIRPVIILPECWRSWDDEELDAVLAHEVAHQFRGDWWVTFLCKAAHAMHFYHPLSHWVYRRLRLEQELAADTVAASLLGDRASYARSLAKLALEADRAHGLPQPVLNWGGSHLLKRMSEMKRMESRSLRDHLAASSHGGFSKIMMFAFAGVLSVLMVGIRTTPAEETSDDEEQSLKSIWETVGRSDDVWVQARLKPLLDHQQLKIVRAFTHFYLETVGIKTNEDLQVSGNMGVASSQICDEVWKARNDAQGLERLSKEYRIDEAKITADHRHRVIATFGSILRVQDARPHPIEDSVLPHEEFLKITNLYPHRWEKSTVASRPAWKAFSGDEASMAAVADGDDWIFGPVDDVSKYLKENDYRFGDGIDSKLLEAANSSDIALLLGEDTVRRLFQDNDAKLMKAYFPFPYADAGLVARELRQVGFMANIGKTVTWELRFQFKPGYDARPIADGFNKLFSLNPTYSQFFSAESALSEQGLRLQLNADGNLMVLSGEVRIDGIDEMLLSKLGDTPGFKTDDRRRGWFQLVDWEDALCESGVNICHVPNASPQFGLLQAIDATPYRGKRLRIGVRSHEIASDAKLRLFAVCDDQNYELISGTSHYLEPGDSAGSVEVDVPIDARSIAFGASAWGSPACVTGFSLDGIGSANHAVQVVPAELGRFSYLAMIGCQPHATPVNLNFDESIRMTDRTKEAPAKAVSR
ncbi:MAG: M56 family metallopeptidase [Planctomycetota bacterium]